MSYKEIQVPSSTIIEIYSKALAEVEKFKGVCLETENKRIQEYTIYVKNKDKDLSMYYDDHFQVVSYCYSGIAITINGIKACLDAARLSDCVTMTKSQVITMQQYETKEEIKRIQNWLEKEWPFCTKEPDTKIAETSQIDTPEDPTLPSQEQEKPKEPSAYAIVLPWIAILCGILFGLTHCS